MILAGLDVKFYLQKEKFFYINITKARNAGYTKRAKSGVNADLVSFLQSKLFYCSSIPWMYCNVLGGVLYYFSGTPQVRAGGCFYHL